MIALTPSNCSMFVNVLPNKIFLKYLFKNSFNKDVFFNLSNTITFTNSLTTSWHHFMSRKLIISAFKKFLLSARY